jgi:uncharacterized membrane protein
MNDSGKSTATSEKHELEIETRVEAPAAVLLVISLQALVATLSLVNHWTVWILPWWGWLIPVGPELALIVPLAMGVPIRLRRVVGIALLVVMAAVNLVALTVLIGSIVKGQERSGGQLLLKGIAVWTTNVVAFGLGFWELDRYKRDENDFQFPQMENPELAPRGWRPHLVDYLYVSFTNSIAFSPTDAMPLTRRAKLLMLAESSVSAIAILLVAARAVNIFK